MYNRAKLNELQMRAEALQREKLTLDTQTSDTVKADRLRSFIHTFDSNGEDVQESSTEAGVAFTEFIDRATVKKGEYIEFTFTCGITLRQSIAPPQSTKAASSTADAEPKKAKHKTTAA